ncbi:MAG: transglutaminase family protein [Actinomycetota bacterium]
MTNTHNQAGGRPEQITKNEYLSATPMLNFDDRAIADLVASRGWSRLDTHERIGAIYEYVRDEIEFGYNADDNVPASTVLSDGFGQCNTKSTLLMALLRAAGVPCRFHAATIHKRLQRGVVRGIWYRLAPEEILHSWVEVQIGDEWIRLEGVILDKSYLDGLRSRVPDPTGPFLGCAVGTDSLLDPPIDWKGAHTEIQMTGVNGDLGIFDEPDTFYSAHGTNLTGIKTFVYQHLTRHLMNRRVGKIRSSSGRRHRLRA